MTASATISACWLSFELTSSYTEHAPRQNDDATGQKRPRSHTTQTEGGTLALQSEKDVSKGRDVRHGEQIHEF